MTRKGSSVQVENLTEAIEQEGVDQMKAYEWYHNNDKKDRSGGGNMWERGRDCGGCVLSCPSGP